MPKNIKSKRESSCSDVPKARNTVVVVVAALILITAGAALTQKTNSSQARAQKPGGAQSTQMTPASHDAASPSKEYIYAGGRLVATEEPQGCLISLASTSQSFAAATPSGAINTGTVSVSAPSGCNWSATVTSGSSFITVTSGAGGAGNGAVNYTVAHNTSTSIRSGSISISGQIFTVLQGVSFSDVHINHPYYTEIGKLSARGVTAGCGLNPPIYCPDGNVDRAQMSVFLLRALGAPTPPVATVQSFCDVPPGPNPPRHWAYDFIEEFYRIGLTAGCSLNCPSNPPLSHLRMYCPEDSVTHAQMAVFMLRALGVTGTPPASGQSFYDVPPSHWAYNFIEEFYSRGIWSGCATACNPPSGWVCYCPESSVSRAQMAVLMVRAFNL